MRLGGCADDKTGTKIVNEEGSDDTFHPIELNVEMTFHSTPPIISTKQANK